MFTCLWFVTPWFSRQTQHPLSLFHNLSHSLEHVYSDPHDYFDVTHHEVDRQDELEYEVWVTSLFSVHPLTHDAVVPLHWVTVCIVFLWTRSTWVLSANPQSNSWDHFLIMADLGTDPSHWCGGMQGSQRGLCAEQLSKAFIRATCNMHEGQLRAEEEL